MPPGAQPIADSCREGPVATISAWTAVTAVGIECITTANTVFLGASKDFGMLTAYGGVASESSNMVLDYEYEDTGDVISFEVEGRQSSRLTLGGALNLGAMRLNLEIGHGEMTTYSAGLMFGL